MKKDFTADYVKREDKLSAEEEQWAVERELLERQTALDADKARFQKPARKKSTSKRLMAFLMLNCTAVQVFAAWATVQNIALASANGTPLDFTPLVALIGAVVGEVVGMTAYLIKSSKENTMGGITFETAMLEKRQVQEFGEMSDSAVG